VVAVALPFLGGVGLPELIIITVIMLINCFPVVLMIVIALLVARSQGRSHSAPRAPQVAASWLPDPTGRHELRYWDGSQWTRFVSDAGAQGEDAL